MTSPVGITPFTGLASAPKFSASPAATSPGMKTVTVAPQSDKATLNEQQTRAVAPHSGQTAASQLTGFDKAVGNTAGAFMYGIQRLIEMTGNNQPVSQRQTAPNASASRLQAIA
jgi:hypothetical protein